MLNETDAIVALSGLDVESPAQRGAVYATVLSADAAVAAPTIVVQKNVNGYASGSTPTVTGQAAPNTTIKIFTSDGTQVGSTTVDDSKLFSLALSPFKDGKNYGIYATATDSAGHVSDHSDLISFNVDATAPVAPQATMSISIGSNTAYFSGIGEAGSAIDLVQPGATIQSTVIVAHTTVDNTGHWSLTTSPMPNGNYNLRVVSSDLAYNATTATSSYSFNVSNPNNVVGTAGNDTIKLGSAPNIAIDGGDGIDTLKVNGASTSYTVAKEAWGYGLTDNAGQGGHDALINVERIDFSDVSVALDLNGNAGQLYRLYQAAFDRAPDLTGMGYWIMRMDAGASLLTVSHEFMTNQPEFDRLYGATPTDAEFITHLYNNVLHRDPDASGYNFWIQGLKNDPNARAQILADFSESPENQALVIGSIQNGMHYTPWHTTA